MQKSGLVRAISPRLTAASALLCAGLGLAGDYTTLSINSVPAYGPTVLTNEITIGSNQVAQIVALPLNQMKPAAGIFLDIEKQGITYTWSIAPSQFIYDWRDITPIAGPVTIRLRGITNSGALPLTAEASAYCTVKVTPEAFSPEKTVVVTPGSGGANVALERSTNLADWSTATNGIYGGLSNACFFRINLNRSGFVPPVPPDGSIASQVNAQTTTLFTGSGSGIERPTDEISINEYQTAEIIAVGKDRGVGLELWRGSQVFPFKASPQISSWKDWSPIRGPATFKLSIGSSMPVEGYCTIRVFTEQYPPDKTVITLPGTNTYAVTLEGSTDLVNWAAATNGTYTVPQAMFFRIRSDLIASP